MVPPVTNRESPVARVIPWVPTRQWVVSLPIPLRYWMAPSRELTAKVHTIIRRTIGQYDVNQAVKQGAIRARVQPGSVTFLQRFGGSLNANLHYHLVFLEGVFVDRTAHGLKPRFVQADPPTDAEIAVVLHKISQRVIRHLRKRGYLEADTQDVVPTGYDPALEEDPELARTMAAASVQQRIAFGERAGQKVRRIGSGFGDADERRAELELARLLKRVFSIDMERCPACQQGRLRIIAAITEVNVIQKILRHLKLADSPPIAPAQ